jgi:uncharacterized protein YbjQ (UPF0145 family)
MELLVQFVVFLTLLAGGLVFGRANERRHYRDLQRREAALRGILVFNERRLPADRLFNDAHLVVGSVVIAEDFFKRVAASLKSFFGGRLSTYESLVDRGRREAIVRMKQAAAERGATMIFNVRLETASLSDDGGQSPTFSAEFLAYGTALRHELRQP